MADHLLQDWFKLQIEHQKSSHLRVTGKHNSAVAGSSTVQEITDFDFKMVASEFITLVMVEITASSDRDRIEMIITEDDHTGEEILIRRSIAKLVDTFTSKFERVILGNKIKGHESAISGLQKLANLARYGGRIYLEHTDITDTFSRDTTKISASEVPWIAVEMVWRYRAFDAVKPVTRPFIRSGPTPMNWHRRIQHAMIDGQQGPITLEDEVKQGDYSPTSKALQNFGLYERTSSNTSRLHAWGKDETEGEAPIPGYIKYIPWTSIRLESPPPYSEEGESQGGLGDDP